MSTKIHNEPLCQHADGFTFVAQTDDIQFSCLQAGKNFSVLAKNFELGFGGTGIFFAHQKPKNEEEELEYKEILSLAVNSGLIGLDAANDDKGRVSAMTIHPDRLSMAVGKKDGSPVAVHLEDNLAQLFAGREEEGRHSKVLLTDKSLEIKTSSIKLSAGNAVLEMENNLIRLYIGEERKLVVRMDGQSGKIVVAQGYDGEKGQIDNRLEIGATQAGITFREGSFGMNETGFVVQSPGEINLEAEGFLKTKAIGFSGEYPAKHGVKAGIVIVPQK